MSAEIKNERFFGLIEGLCSLHRIPFSSELARQQLAAPFTQDALHDALQVYGFKVAYRSCKAEKFHKEALPLVVWLRPAPEDGDMPGAAQDGASALTPALILRVESGQILLIEPGVSQPEVVSLADFNLRYGGYVTRVTPTAKAVADPDGEDQAREARTFGFRWFVPELLKHRKLWHEIVLASLVIQLIALATPLFTQTIIDKVVVHHSQGTLVVIAIGMFVFMLFSAALSWLRQYLVLHTGNRVDAVLGAAVFERLFRLPPMYFQHRPTGVISARLHGVETIREFVASAAVTLVLDFPFLLIFVGVMFYYSVSLTLIVLAILGVIVGLSLAVAPMFQTRLQEQFRLGARNQAFVTEYVAGLETVKSLQLEPQLSSTYRGYLAGYLQAGFATKHLANSYNTLAGFLEQLMSLLILGIGAYTVMHSTEFTIGMLVAFQMFAGKLSQPMLRLVGLWQQFQQASLSVARLGDVMNAPVEHYSVLPSRANQRDGLIEIDQVAFRYGEKLPLLYRDLSLTILPGQAIAVMGPSGCGKSTLAKLLQGFYAPSAGRIRIDGVDASTLSANELRSYFGVVPQETTLFSGTIYDNLHMANPQADFQDIVRACKMAEIHKAIEALPQGYQTEIGERGAGLSGGQKQRVAIARALLKFPRILVFDEATSALDSATAEQFAQTINRLKGQITMLFITHGLPKGLHIDAIYRLTEQGAQNVTIVPARPEVATGLFSATTGNVAFKTHTQPDTQQGPL